MLPCLSLVSVTVSAFSFRQGSYDRRERILQRSTSQGSIGSPVYNRHGYTPTLSRSPQHFHRPGMSMLHFGTARVKNSSTFFLPTYVLVHFCGEVWLCVFDILRKQKSKENLSTSKSKDLTRCQRPDFWPNFLTTHFIISFKVLISLVSTSDPCIYSFCPLPPHLPDSSTPAGGSAPLIWLPSALQRLWQACRSSAPPSAVTVWAPEIMTPAPPPLSDTTSSPIAKVRAPLNSSMLVPTRQHSLSTMSPSGHSTSCPIFICCCSGCMTLND